MKTFINFAVLALLWNAHGAIAHAHPSVDFTGDPRMGVCTHFAQGWSAENVMPEIEKSGFGWIRDDLGWESIEKSKGEYKIPDYTLAWIRAAHAHHIRVLLILNGSNKLYADQYDPPAFAKWAAWTAAELKNDIDALEILNEPNNFGYSKYYGGQHEGEGDSPWVAKYVTLMNAAAEAIKAVNPAMPVIGFGGGAPVTYRQLALGTSPAVDAIADHPYSNQSPPEWVPSAADQMKKFGFTVTDERSSFASLIDGFRRESKKRHGPKSIRLTEWGFSTYQPLTAGQFGGFNETAQAKYILRRFVQGFAMDIQVSFIYEFRDGRDSHDAEQCWGVLRENGEQKESWAAVNNLAATFHGIRAAKENEVGPVNVFPAATWPQQEPIAVYRFVDEKSQPAVAIWATDRAGGDRQPRVGEIELMWGAGIKSIAAIDLLSGKSDSVQFKHEGNRLLVEAAMIHDYPVLYKASGSGKTLGDAGGIAQQDLKLFDEKKYEWAFNDGREFAGATGSFALARDGDKPVGALHYDFTNGGAYVAGQTHLSIARDAAEFRIAIKSTQGMRMSIRLVDVTGQCHQFAESCSGTGSWETIRVVLTGKASEHWGGANDGKMHFPINELSLCVNKPAGDASGTVEFADGVTVK